jgi:hypothetical protein
MKNRFILSIAVLGTLSLGVNVPLSAHHGTGVSYDASKPTTLKGNVTEFRYANPHPQLFFDVKDDNGNVVHWSGEFYPNPAQLVQLGWGRKRSEAALAPGTPITVVVAPARAGGPVGAIIKLLNDKGEPIVGSDGTQAPPPPPPAETK